MKTWTFSDKTQWPERGPWDQEPDKAQWIDEKTGLDCLMVRARGHWCGYVGIPEGHPEFGKDDNDVNIEGRPHGGITFAGLCQEGDEEPRICHVPEPGRSERIWWLGFDCAHFMDRRPAMTQFEYDLNRDLEAKYPGTLHRQSIYRDFEYVRAEVTALAAQLGGTK